MTGSHLAGTFMPQKQQQRDRLPEHSRHGDQDGYGYGYQFLTIEAGSLGDNHSRCVCAVVSRPGPGRGRACSL